MSRSSPTPPKFLPKGLFPLSPVQIGAPLTEAIKAALVHHPLDLDVSSTLDHHAFGNVDIRILFDKLMVVKQREQRATGVLARQSRVLHRNPLAQIFIALALHASPTVSVNWQAFHLVAEYAKNDHETTFAVDWSSLRQRQFGSFPQKLWIHVRNMKRYMQDLTLHELDSLTLLSLLPADILGWNGTMPAGASACTSLALT